MRCAVASRAAACVVQEDGVGFEVAGRAVHEYHRHTHLHLGHEVAVVLGSRDDQQAVDATFHKGPDEFPLHSRVLVGTSRDDQAPAITGRPLDRSGDAREEWVTDILDDQADRAGGMAHSQQPRHIVAAEAKSPDDLLNPRGGRCADAGLTVQHPRNRLRTDSGPFGDITKRRTAGRTERLAGRRVIGGLWPQQGRLDRVTRFEPMSRGGPISRL